MTSTTTTAVPLSALATTFARMRCRQPTRVERMKQSLQSHGQLTPLVAAARPSAPELIDGFKRYAAASMLGIKTVLVTVRPLDETAQWATMLQLNRGPQSMTAVEEALILRELVTAGLTQIEIASLLERHKTWVSRRIGLVDRLHPELVEQMKIGLLPPGVARRLLSLPPGNQLEVSAAALSSRLGPRDTELLVSLWHKAKDPNARRALLSNPRASLARERPETTRSPANPRLSAMGQRIQRTLRVLDHTATRTRTLLREPLSAFDLELLKPELRRTSTSLGTLVTALGSTASAGSGAGSDASDATS
jgi:ParB/RepB/Spo0J family partition protein